MIEPLGHAFEAILLIGCQLSGIFQSGCCLKHTHGGLGLRMHTPDNEAKIHKNVLLRRIDYTTQERFVATAEQLFTMKHAITRNRETWRCTEENVGRKVCAGRNA
jgi:hypothetical protein